jgi:hypothetical protein
MNRLVVFFAVLSFIAVAGAQEENSLTRDEVGAIKKKLVNTLEALGQAPTGYAVERESFNLPTEAYKDQSKGRYYPVSAGANREYGSGKAAEKASTELQEEYQKKIAEAQAKGDYQAMSKIALEMQQKAGAIQLKAVEGKKEPISVHVIFNSNPGATIDPDAVVFERSGVIALKASDEGGSTKGRVSVYFDPVSLKNTKQLSRVDLKQPEGGISKRTAVLSVTVEFSGPLAEIEPWVKKIDTNKVLSQIDSAK